MKRLAMEGCCGESESEGEGEGEAIGLTDLRLCLSWRLSKLHTYIEIEDVEAGHISLVTMKKEQKIIGPHARLKP